MSLYRYDVLPFCRYVVASLGRCVVAVHSSLLRRYCTRGPLLACGVRYSNQLA